VFGENEAAVDLAHEIAFAVFRVARLVRHPKLKAELEAGAVDLVRDFDLAAIEKLARLVRLSEAVAEMSKTNASVLQRELTKLKQTIYWPSARFNDFPENINLAKDFSGNWTEEALANQEVTIANFPKTSHKIKPFGEKGGNNAPAERREAILAFIRQTNGSCRFRDLANRFHQVSTKTLRNDIRQLIAEGRLERVVKVNGALAELRLSS
jgi:hypothetical protein